MLIGVFSIYGMGITYRQHFIFQQTFAEIYRLAESSDERLIVDFPQASSRGLYSLQIEDSLRDLVIGEFPNATIRINVREGGLLKVTELEETSDKSEFP